MSSSGPVLELRGIDKSFAGVVALDGASLSLSPGVVHALVGENGAGKSTLMKILAGVYAPDAGQILLDGAPRGGPGWPMCRRIASTRDWCWHSRSPTTSRCPSCAKWRAPDSCNRRKSAGWPKSTGDSAEQVGPSTADASGQVTWIKSLIRQHVNAIVVEAICAYHVRGGHGRVERIALHCY